MVGLFYDLNYTNSRFYKIQHDTIFNEMVLIKIRVFMNVKIQNMIFFLSLFCVQSYVVFAVKPIGEKLIIDSANLEVATPKPNLVESRVVAAKKDAQLGAKAASFSGNQSSQSHIVDPSSSAKSAGVSIENGMPDSWDAPGTDVLAEYTSKFNTDPITRQREKGDEKRGENLLAQDKAGMSSWEKVSLNAKKAVTQVQLSVTKLFKSFLQDPHVKIADLQNSLAQTSLQLRDLPSVDTYLAASLKSMDAHFDERLVTIQKNKADLNEMLTIEIKRLKDQAQAQHKVAQLDLVSMKKDLQFQIDPTTRKNKFEEYNKKVADLKKSMQGFVDDVSKIKAAASKPVESNSSKSRLSSAGSSDSFASDSGASSVSLGSARSGSDSFDFSSGVVKSSVSLSKNDQVQAGKSANSSSASSSKLAPIKSMSAADIAKLTSPWQGLSSNSPSSRDIFG